MAEIKSSILAGNYIGDTRLRYIPENKVVFSSGSGTQLSWEDPELELSVFTYYLIEGIQGEASENKNPQFVDLGELAKYVQNKVFQHTRNSLHMEPQLPSLFEAKGVTNEDFPIAIRRQP